MMFAIMIVIYALCTASISFTITTASIFGWLREWVGEESKLGELLHCPYCLGHYIALAILALDTSHYVPVTDFIIIQQIITWFAVMGLTGMFHFVLLRAYEPVTKAAFMRARERAQNKTKSVIDS